MKHNKVFYEEHTNFSGRTITEYFISPGIYHKFNLILKEISSCSSINTIDLGSSGNSLLHFLNDSIHKSCFDLSENSLKQYTKKSQKNKIRNEFWHPLCGTITSLPYRDQTFDLISCLDVLEHIKDDSSAIREISRILKKGGLVIITVPHRNAYYSEQDKLIGHHRRYEIPELISQFFSYKLRLVKILKVYGRLMRISDIQSRNPEGIESGLSSLRERYERSLLFRSFWDVIVRIGAYMMKLDTKISPLGDIMNIGIILKKI
ncbi:MAG: SAM-dependent methyltransferase [Promethearchaeota archaeon]|nr:MAG: SAM-dependent methyltransferase [Candidatus Lokiarchaeota archaeon]